MNPPQRSTERLDELLADQALFGLSDEDQHELEQLLSSSSADPETFERIAAMAALALRPKPTDELPDELKQKIRDSYFSHHSQQILPTTLPDLARNDLPDIRDEEPRKQPVLRSREIFAWLVAVACLVVISVNLWLNSAGPRVQISLVDSRLNLLKSDNRILQSTFSSTDDPSGRGVVGDVVWSNRLQKGFLRFRGLRKNDPTHSQYQVWIFDAKKDERFPIDGGVFNIDSDTGESIVEIDAKLRVVEPTMFAVTIERPGGVVVSTRSRLILVSKPDEQRG